MKRNVGTLDRVARLVLGAVLLALHTPVAVVAGIVLLVTGATGRCPLYLPLHFDTTRFDREAKA